MKRWFSSIDRTVTTVILLDLTVAGIIGGFKYDRWETAIIFGLPLLLLPVLAESLRPIREFLSLPFSAIWHKLNKRH